jgi:hypothetical protein
VATEVPGVDGSPHGTVGTEMAAAGVSGDATSGDVALAPWSLDAMSPGLLRLYPPGSPGSMSVDVSYAAPQVHKIINATLH